MHDVHSVLLYSEIGTNDLNIMLFLNFVSLRIYAVGGRDGAAGLRETESYDPHTNRWSPCAPMQKRRGGVAVAACNNFLFAIGGHESSATNKCTVRFDDGERYDPRCDQWTLITSLNRPKGSFSHCFSV